MDALKKEIGQLETDYRDVQTAIRKASPRYAAITQPQPLKMEEIQQQVLGPDVLLLEYALGEDRSYLWAVTHRFDHQLRTAETRIDPESDGAGDRTADSASLRQRNETPPQRTRRIAEADAALPEAAKQLSDMILAPADKLANRRLLIVPDGALQYLPFAMLFRWMVAG